MIELCSCSGRTTIIISSRLLASLMLWLIAHMNFWEVLAAFVYWTCNHRSALGISKGYCMVIRKVGMWAIWTSSDCRTRPSSIRDIENKLGTHIAVWRVAQYPSSIRYVRKCALTRRIPTKPWYWDVIYHRSPLNLHQMKDQVSRSPFIECLSVNQRSDQ